MKSAILLGGRAMLRVTLLVTLVVIVNLVFSLGEGIGSDDILSR